MKSAPVYLNALMLIGLSDSNINTASYVCKQTFCWTGSAIGSYSQSASLMAAGIHKCRVTELISNPCWGLKSGTVYPNAPMLFGWSDSNVNTASYVCKQAPILNHFRTRETFRMKGAPLIVVLASPATLSFRHCYDTSESEQDRNDPERSLMCDLCKSTVPAMFSY